MVLVEGTAEPERFSEKKVKPLRAARAPSQVSLRDPVEVVRRTLQAPTAIQVGTVGERSYPPSLVVAETSLTWQPKELPAPRQVPKPSGPSRSESYLEFVRRQPCCNCQAPPRSDPDHVGPRGVGQKTDDFRCIPLCRRCHQTRTDQGVLPVPTPQLGPVVLRSPGETARLVLETQLRLLTQVLTRLTPAERLEALVGLLGQVEPARLRELLRV